MTHMAGKKPASSVLKRPKISKDEHCANILASMHACASASARYVLHDPTGAEKLASAALQLGTLYQIINNS